MSIDPIKVEQRARHNHQRRARVITWLGLSIGLLVGVDVAAGAAAHTFTQQNLEPAMAHGMQPSSHIDADAEQATHTQDTQFVPASFSKPSKPRWRQLGQWVRREIGAIETIGAGTAAAGGLLLACGLANGRTKREQDAVEDYDLTQEYDTGREEQLAVENALFDMGYQSELDAVERNLDSMEARLERLESQLDQAFETARAAHPITLAHTHVLGMLGQDPGPALTYRA